MATDLLQRRCSKKSLNSVQRFKTLAVTPLWKLAFFEI